LPNTPQVILERTPAGCSASAAACSASAAACSATRRGGPVDEG